MSQGMPRTAAQIDVAFPGGSPARAQPLDVYRTTVRRGERAASSNIGSCPRVRIRLQTSASNISCLSRAQAKREASEGWTTRAASQDSRGELFRTKRGAVPKEGVSDRGKPSLSRGAVETVSIPRAPRKPTCKGGGVTRGVTRRQRQSREWSETAFWDRLP